MAFALLSYSTILSRSFLTVKSTGRVLLSDDDERIFRSWVVSSSRCTVPSLIVRRYFAWNALESRGVERKPAETQSQFRRFIQTLMRHRRWSHHLIFPALPLITRKMTIQVAMSKSRRVTATSTLETTVSPMYLYRTILWKTLHS